MMLSNAANGAFTKKTFNEIVDIFEDLVSHNELWCSQRSKAAPKKQAQTSVLVLDIVMVMMKQMLEEMALERKNTPTTPMQPEFTASSPVELI